MHISALVAQFPVSLSIQRNLTSIQEILKEAREGDLVVLPEGSVSGYSDDLSFLGQVDAGELDQGLDHLRKTAQDRGIHIWVGACYRKDGHWFNAAWGFDPHGNRHTYHKVNLATHERGTFSAGADLPVYPLRTSSSVATIGVQLCRELRFPEQWGWLARQGAQLILHLNNAIGNSEDRSVWRSLLVSRAAETQRFVVSANNAAANQRSPTIVIAPSGRVLEELPPGQEGIIRVDLDLAEVSNWYLGQCRTDLVAICRAGEMDEEKA